MCFQDFRPIVEYRFHFPENFKELNQLETFFLPAEAVKDNDKITLLELNKICKCSMQMLYANVYVTLLVSVQYH